jgi:hypothetical protein
VAALDTLSIAAVDTGSLFVVSGCRQRREAQLLALPLTDILLEGRGHTES